jgi:hypothetical protein
MTSRIAIFEFDFARIKPNPRIRESIGTGGSVADLQSEAGTHPGGLRPHAPGEALGFMVVSGIEGEVDKKLLGVGWRGPSGASGHEGDIDPACSRLQWHAR